MTYCTYDTNCQNPIIIEKLLEENKQLKAQMKKMKCCHSCKSHKLNNLKNCQTCDEDYSRWELAE